MADIELTAADGHVLSAHRADPVRPPTGGVVVLQEIFGVNDHIRDVTDRFAAAGLVAVAPALFDRVRAGVELAYDGDGVKAGRLLAWDTLSLDEALLDVAAAVELLADELGGPGTVGVVGFCYGGMLAAAAASRTADHLGAAVAYYPSRAAQVLPDDQPQVPLQLQLGDQDQGVTVADGAVLAERWPSATVHRYPQAGHGFNCDRREGHDPEASTLAWARTLAFLHEHLTPPSGSVVDPTGPTGGEA